MKFSGTLEVGQPVCQDTSAVGTIKAADGYSNVIGICDGKAGEVGGDETATFACQPGTVVETNRTDLVISTTYYAAADGTYATTGAANQELGVAVTNTAISLDLPWLQRS